MTFQELQSRLESLHLDTRPEWITGGVKNKEAINIGLKEVFEKFIRTFTGERLMRTEKYNLTLTNNTADLPSDFRTLSKDENGNSVFVKVGNTYHSIDIQYSIQYGNPYKIVFSRSPVYPVYIDYVKNYTNLVNNSDVPNLPQNLHESIVDYALVEYFRQQRDWNNVGPALQYAEGKVKERMNNIWLN